MKALLLAIAILLCGKMFSQKITDYFLMLPDSSVLDLPKEEREKIVQTSSDNKSNEDLYADFDKGIKYGFSVMDVKNGYLKMEGLFEGQMQFCYWNKADGTKLIAAYQEGCGPGCVVEQFDFYIYDGKKLTAADRSKIIPDVYKDFFTGDYEKKKSELEDEGVFTGMLFQLPCTGKNIVATLGDNTSSVDLKSIAKGNRMELVWNDGSFKKGKMWWVENTEY